ncbi:hypothetical protein PHELEMICH_53 [Mycobacterium phage Phelemich]|uniref:Uncharacterized protein n=2 Tax=Acadianvirus reprobate TaxID=1982903 RepID=S5Y7R4_9CAUD|nr:hypothetical protein N847_gp53 [Mycobacterium phage Phelemich]YP_008409975.1 hypothetical protein REPROBATE_54 [Mycobacterium phage Reprobate]AGT12790.1 hypothetical protein REPROBATE_54 [Mycobacterium phage Reprobate]AGT13967.1 hypothetical protein PHELEMICH_53 [Mycobacterium phage Phelemich]
MSVTFKTQALIDAAESVIALHDEAVAEWERKTAAHQARHRDLWWENNRERVTALRNYLTRSLKNDTPPTNKEANRLMATTSGYVQFFVPTGEPSGDKPDGYYVKNLGDLPGLVAMLQAHTGDTISANELKLVGYDRLTQLFQLAAAAGGRVDK